MLNDYDKLKEIEVHSQTELDDIPEDFAGRIYIRFGAPGSRAVVNKRYKGYVEAMENSSVEAWENSSVVARGNSSVVARENSYVEAMENSYVEAMENSYVEAWENSSVEGNGNAQIVDNLTNGKIHISGNVRIVHNPKTIDEYCAFHGIKHSENKVKLYKAVHKKDNRYFSDYDINFEYAIGKSIKADNFDNNVLEDCGYGIHLSHKEWAVDFGREWSDLAILECEADMDGIVVPVSGAGKVRTPKVKVIREVPLEECGLLGKIIQKRSVAHDLQKQ